MLLEPYGPVQACNGIALPYKQLQVYHVNVTCRVKLQRFAQLPYSCPTFYGKEQVPYLGPILLELFHFTFGTVKSCCRTEY